MKNRATLRAALLLLGLTGLCHADWFVSSDTKAMIKRAESGDVDAQLHVGSAYDYGHGAPHDPEEAMRWYRMAADQGNAEAQNSVGSMLQEKKQYVDAMAWYEKAAAQGHVRATNSIAYLFDLGLGVVQDRQKAFALYSHAADLGSAEAMWNIANMYGAGQLGAVDTVSACIWVRRAGKWAPAAEAKVRAIATRALSGLEGSLSDEQRARCQSTAEEWKPASLAR